MGKLREQVKNLRALNMEQVVLGAVKEFEAPLLDINIDQLMHGEDSEENPVEPFYRSAAYAEYKLSLNPLGVVDLRDTGAFHSSFFARVDKFPITIFARDVKTPELVEKYGTEIFGLNKDNKGEFSKDYVLPETAKAFLKALRV